MNANYRKGRAAEYKTQRLLEAAGYQTFRMAGSHSPIDVIAVSGLGIRLVQVKSGRAGASPLDREVLHNLVRPKNSTVEIWRWRDRVREPSIERL